MRYNLHTHTYRCNHATGSDREYVEKAIESGIKVLGFSDHCPQFFPNTDYYSHFRMRPELCEDYVKSVRALQKEYENDIKILLGFETEYYPATYEKFMEFIKPFELDYMIMGQHFVGNEYDEGSYYAPEKARKEKFLEQYVDQVKEGLNKGVFTYLAHPDIVYYSGSYDFYCQKITELCEYAKEMDIPLEYNILGYVNKRSYPTPQFWEIAAKTGNKVVLGFDAHRPEALSRFDIFEECVANLKERGIQPIHFEDINIRKI